jgi:hypothetical protein
LKLSGPCDTKAHRNCPSSKGSFFMAIDPTGGHAAMDYPEHLRTYRGFLKATAILIAFVVAVLLFLLTLVP